MVGPSLPAPHAAGTCIFYSVRIALLYPIVAVIIFTTSTTAWAKVPALFNILPFVIDTELLLAQCGSQ